MSFSKEAFFRDAQEAAGHVDSWKDIPLFVREFILAALNHLPNKMMPVQVGCNGHICDGPGSYSTSNCSITVKPMEFSVKVPA